MTQDNDDEFTPLDEWTYQPTLFESLEDDEQVTWTQMENEA